MVIILIYVKMQGRLGNQLFQYAFAKSLKNKFYPNEKLYFQFPKNKKDTSFQNSLIYFNVKDLNSTEKIKINISQKTILYFYILYRKLIRTIFKFNLLELYNFEIKYTPLLNRFGIYCLSTGYYDFNSCKYKNKIIIGSFESSKYFKEIDSEIKKEFTPTEKIKVENIELYDSIKNSNSVCISIRRGDFLSSKYKEKYFVCDNKYFEKAIKFIQKKIPDAKFFVFSDDIKWCRKNLKFPKGTEFESGNDPVWEKLRLMYSCKHFIISNSTFSWWAQYLSKNKNKIVIAPSKWQNSPTTKAIYEEDWITID